MKRLISAFVLAALLATIGFAHEHIEIAFDAPPNRNRLAPYGDTAHTVTYFPPGEMPSNNFLVFPGGTFTTELTFSSFDNVNFPPGNVFVRVRVLSVAGPSGGSFSFWESNAAAPTWTRASGWATTPGDVPSFSVSEDNEGYGHRHGRAFTFGKAGDYDVTFQAVDDLGNYTASQPFVIRFTAILPPQPTIAIQGEDVSLSFSSRENLTYDIQSSTTLAPNSWQTIDTVDGTGGAVQWSEPLENRPRVFYRLVEYP